MVAATYTNYLIFGTFCFDQTKFAVGHEPCIVQSILCIYPIFFPQCKKEWLLEGSSSQVKQLISFMDSPRQFMQIFFHQDPSFSQESEKITRDRQWDRAVKENSRKLFSRYILIHLLCDPSIMETIGTCQKPVAIH